MSKEFYEQQKRKKRRFISKEAFEALQEADRRQGNFSAEIRNAQKELRDDLFTLPPSAKSSYLPGRSFVGTKKESWKETDARVSRETKKLIEANRKAALVRQLVRRNAKQGAFKHMKKMYEYMKLVRL